MQSKKWKENKEKNGLQNVQPQLHTKKKRLGLHQN